VGILNVEVEVILLDLLYRDTPGIFILFPVRPPFLFRIEFFDPDRLGLGI